METLTIKIEDTKLLGTLADMAKAHGQPVEAEVHALLAKAAEEHAIRQDRFRRAQEISSMTPKGVKQTDSVELIREMREERMSALGC